MRSSICFFIFGMALAFGWESAPSFAGGVGNGGGVICVSGKCLTLAEAGLRVRPNVGGKWVPNATLIQETKNLISKYPLSQEAKDIILRQTFGRMDHFRYVDTVDSDKFEEIKTLYMSIARESRFPIDEETFQVAAISSDDMAEEKLTYILPVFLGQGPLQQAKILVHEGMYRGKSWSRLPLILEFEGAFEQYTKTRTWKEIDQLVIQIKTVGYYLGVNSKEEALSYILQCILENEASSRLAPSMLGNIQFSKGVARLTIDHNKILDLSDKVPILPLVFSQVDHIDFIAHSNLSECTTTDLHNLSQKAFADYFRYPVFLGVGGSTIELWQLESKMGCTAGYTERTVYRIVEPEKLDLILR